ncbi:MAG: CapA family protein [Spirochaetaceae bacterium]|jgi:poly-gamma-glutamate synthesis protein (capsule biosynthesis protein)|nr:CapA family protein [Spirochaetaceae bacterium]
MIRTGPRVVPVVLASLIFLGGCALSPLRQSTPDIAVPASVPDIAVPEAPLPAVILPAAAVPEESPGPGEVPADTTPPGEPQAEAAAPPLRLTFAGDLMAHEVNVSMDDFSLIYRDIEAIIQNDDFSFINMETPVCAERPYRTYPAFNVQPPYADAAVNAGFEVFSLANNHTNDQGRAGIQGSYSYFSQKPGVWAAGIREKAGDSISWQMLQKNGWRILFAAVTELLNSPSNQERIDYYPPPRREALIAAIKALRAEHPADIFVLSVHSAEEEYVRTVSRSRREFYAALINAGVDVVWANHIHAAREWEILGPPDTITGVIFYSCGNTISGQRTRYNFDNPASDRDYTGEGFLFSVDFSRTPSGGWEILRVSPTLITTYRDRKDRYVIRRLDGAFIEELRRSGSAGEAAYFEKRKTLMGAIQGKRILP